jgi:hypothetical protein
MRWILSMLDDQPDPEDLNTVEGMDCLKVEFVPKRELTREDLNLLKTAGFKPAGKGCVWPQFRASEPGWHPWYINQTEAEQLVADVPRLTAFCKMYEQCPDLYDGRTPTEIPFVPAVLPDRPLAPSDLDWRPFLPPPPPDLQAYQPAVVELEKLRVLKRAIEMTCEFDLTMFPGSSFYENDRPCFGRCSLLVETQNGLILGTALQSGALSVGEAVGRGFIETLLMAGTVPVEIVIGGSRFQPVLQPLCDALQIRLRPASTLPFLEQAVASLGQFMSGRR